MATLTLAELQKAQAEVEGFQNGPAPALNNANLYTQATAGNPQPTPPAPTPVPYYPSSETPNLQLSTRDVSSEIANNFVILDRVLTTNFPIIQAFLQQTNVNTTQSASVVAPAGAPSFYEVPMYLNSRGDGAGGSTVTLTLQWTGVSGVVHTAVQIVSGTVAGQVQLETLPVLVLGGSTVTITTAFSSTSFHYDVVSRFQALPL